MQTPPTLEQIVRELIQMAVKDGLVVRGPLDLTDAELTPLATHMNEQMSRWVDSLGVHLSARRTSRTEELLAREIVKRIVADIEDRRGLKSEWRAIDEVTQNEIRKTWEGIIRGIE